MHIFMYIIKKMSVCVTRPKKIEIRNVNDNLKSKCKGMFKSNLKVPFKNEIESKFQTYNFEGYCKIEL